MPQPVRAFHIVGDQFTELEAPPEALPATGYLWVATARPALEAALGDVQARLQAWTGAQLFDLHVLDLLNTQVPSSFDYTSAYDILVFRRLAASAVAAIDDDGAPTESRQNAIDLIDTSPVGFVVFDRVLAHRPPDRLPGARVLRQPAAEPDLVDRRGPCQRAHADQPGRPDAAHGQLHGRQLPRAAPGAHQAARRSAGAALRRARRQCRLASPAQFAQRPAPARGHLRGPARGDHRVGRRARRVARARATRRSGASASSCGCARATCSSTSSA